MKQLSVRRAKDRDAMAKAVREIFEGVPNSCIEVVPNYFNDRSIAVGFQDQRGLSVNVVFDATDRQDCRGEFCMAWHVSGRFLNENYESSEAKISEAFGRAMGYSVNEYHHRKCTAFSAGFEDLCAKLRTAVAMLNDGTAYRAP